jgi:FtsP/CotA-like multicopper oxidase with cupredoxin domain
MQLRAPASLTPSADVPARLATIDKIPASAAVATRKLELTSEETINNESMDMNRIDFSPVKGTAEIWDVTNVHDTPHNFHIHDIQFQVLSVDGKTPPPELRGRKDTIFMPPGRDVRLIMKFTDYSDPNHPYMFHCHLVRHEDKGMMGQFTVVDPGQKSTKHLDMENMPGM